MRDNNVVKKFNNYDRESTMKNVKNINDIAAIATAKVTYVVEFKNRVSKTADFKLELN